eukprot:4075448-Pyramimonas_sp.AAC.1
MEKRRPHGTPVSVSSLCCPSPLSRSPFSFNHGLLAILPKVDVADGEAKSILEPMQTRTLTLSNTDNKLISTALAIPFQTQAQYSVVSCQRGFIGGRNLLDNVAQLGSWVVEWACYRGLRYPGKLCLDIAAAFPSVHHSWIFRALDGLRECHPHA